MPLNVAVIGLGIGQQHVIGFDAHPDCRVRVVCDHSSDKLAAAQKEYPGLRVTQHAEEVLADENIDIVSIASFDSDHFPQVMAALANGKHVFVEKPLCQNSAQLEQIKRAWAQHEGRVKLLSNLVLRGAPLYQWLKDRITAGAFGQVYSFDGEYLYGRLPKITNGWRGEIDEYSVMAGGGIHLIDLMRWTTGQRPTSIRTVGNRICTASTRFRHNDFVSATMQFPSGMVGRITSNYGCVHGHQHVVRAFGTEATFLYDDQGARLQVQRDPAPPASALEHDPLPPSKRVLIGGFVEAVVNDRDISDETQADLDVASICFASDASLRNRDEQEIHYT